MASRAQEYADRAEGAEMGGVVCYALSLCGFLGAVVAGGVLLGDLQSPLPAIFPLCGSGALVVAGRRFMRRRDHWADAAHAERELAEGSR